MPTGSSARTALARGPLPAVLARAGGAVIAVQADGRRDAVSGRGEALGSAADGRGDVRRVVGRHRLRRGRLREERLRGVRLHVALCAAAPAAWAPA